MFHGMYVGYMSDKGSIQNNPRLGLSKNAIGIWHAKLLHPQLISH